MLTDFTKHLNFEKVSHVTLLDDIVLCSVCSGKNSSWLMFELIKKSRLQRSTMVHSRQCVFTSSSSN